MATIPEITDRLEAATEKAENASQIIYDVANGDASTEVPTASGPTPTLKKWFQDLGSSLEPMLAGVPARLDKAVLVYGTIDEATVAAESLPDDQIIQTEQDEYFVSSESLVLSKSLPAIPLADYDEVRNYAGPEKRFQVGVLGGMYGFGIFGYFNVDDSDTISPDNGGTVLVDTRGRRIKRQYSGSVYADWWMPDPTGVIGSAAKFNKAIEWCGDHGGDNVVIGAGDYLLENTYTGSAMLTPTNGWIYKRGICINRNNVQINCAGKGKTVFKIADGMNGNAVIFGEALTDTTANPTSSSGMHGFTINGNRANQAAPTATDYHGSGVIMWGGASRNTISDFEIFDTQYYGIGGEMQQNGSFRSNLIENGEIYRSNADGIDFKNQFNNYGNFISNVNIHNPGQAGTDIGVGGQQAGINTRGGFNVSDVGIFGLSGSNHGVRIDQYGGSGKYTPDNYANITVDADSVDTCVGMQINVGVERANVTGLITTGASIGLRVLGTRNNISNVQSFDCPGGVWLFTQNNLDNTIVQNASQWAIYFDGDLNILDGVIVRNSAYFFKTASGADDNIIAGGAVATGASYEDLGLRTVIRDVAGFKTRGSARLQFALDTTAEQTITIPHGLRKAPSLNDVTLTMQRDTLVTDYTIAYFNSYLTDANNIYCKVKCSQASSTTGSKAWLSLQSSAFVGS